MDTKAKLIAAQRLIKVVTGEENGDGMIVTDLGVGYAEPGYHDNETVWVLGDWNDRRPLDRIGRRVRDKSPGRLFDALERLGIEGEWLDEWQKCSNCYKIVRVHGDSYMWKPFYVDLPDGDTLCGECALDPEWIDDVLEPFINCPYRRVTFCDAKVLESKGWVRYNEHPYETGWHQGMDANPENVLDEIQDKMPTVDVLFFKDEASQFYSCWSAFTKQKESEESEDE